MDVAFDLGLDSQGRPVVIGRGCFSGQWRKKAGYHVFDMDSAFESDILFKQDNTLAYFTPESCRLLDIEGAGF